VTKQAQFWRKKPIVVEARQFMADESCSQIGLAEWCGGKLRGMSLPREQRVIRIDTLEGEIEAQVGDWIIKGVKGEFYPCKPDIFTLTYEAVEAKL
jgi:hypothetical protein